MHDTKDPSEIMKLAAPVMSDKCLKVALSE